LAVHAWVFPLTALIVPILLFANRQQGGLGALAALVYYSLTLAPALGLINYSTMYYSYAADHYQYLACAGPLALAAATGVSVLRRIQHSAAAPIRRTSHVLGVTIVLALGLLTWRQTSVCGDLEAFWRRNVRMNPDSPTTHYDLGLVYKDQGRYDLALNELHAAVRLNPNYIEAWMNIGAIKATQGVTDEAIAYQRWATRVRPDHPKARNAQAWAHNNIGKLLSDRGQIEAAIGEFKKAISIEPLMNRAWINWGITLERAGDLHGALEQFRHSTELHPEIAEGYEHLGRVLGKLGRPAEAAPHLRRAVQLSPRSARARRLLGQNLLAAGELHAAAAELVRMIELGLGDADVYNVLGAAYARSGRLDEAILSFRKALELDPEHAAAQSNLSTALERSGR
jgi:tetratricopeptide (TPR) repeat protein